MKSPVNLAALAVVIFCCVHGGVAEGNVREKDEAEPHKIFVTITGLRL